MNADFAPDIARAYEPVRLKNLTLKNRFIKAATFEGKTPGGLPGDDYLAFHRAIARGGVGLTTLAYLAAEADGRMNAHMMHCHDALKEPLAHVISKLKKEGTAVSGQLIHCGGFSRLGASEWERGPRGASMRLNAGGLPMGKPLSGKMSLADIERTTGVYRQAARFMVDVGFDTIEIHFGHGYLLSQFISPKTNRRRDEFGGSLENRMRFPLMVLAAIRSEVGEDFPLLGKISLSDGVRGGLEEGEAIEAGLMLSEGGLDVLIPSGGTSSFNPMMVFRGQSFLTGLIAQEKNPLTRAGMHLVGPAMFPSLPFEELYFLEGARKLKAQASCKVAYIGGCSTRRSVVRVMEAGFDFIQFGRTLIKDPNMVNAMASDPDYENGCTHCNECVPLIDAPGGVTCVLNEGEAREGT